jgi:hypothetical protein
MMKQTRSSSARQRRVAELILVRSMKRWIIPVLAIAILASYAVAYRFVAFRDATRFRNAEVFVHTRAFQHDWQAELFYPAAYIEWLLIRAHPQPWLPHPSWATYPQVLLLESQNFRATFPRNAFRKT